MGPRDNPILVSRETYTLVRRSRCGERLSTKCCSSLALPRTTRGSTCSDSKMCRPRVDGWMISSRRNRCRKLPPTLAWTSHANSEAVGYGRRDFSLILGPPHGRTPQRGLAGSPMAAVALRSGVRRFAARERDLETADPPQALVQHASQSVDVGARSCRAGQETLGPV